MQKIIAYPDGVFLLDSGYVREGLAAIYLIVHDRRAAIIDTGCNASVPQILAALASLNVRPETVDWVMLTHIHLDHAGGAGSLMCALPNARLVVHPRGAHHLVEPGRLWQSSAAVYGPERAFELYGHIVPVQPDCIVAAEAGQVFDLAGRSLEVVYAPGHAQHHICIWDEVSCAFFTGDAFGISYRELDANGRASIFPTTTPTQFDPDAMQETVGCLLTRMPQAMYLAHYGRVTDVERLAADLHRLIDAHIAVAQAARGRCVARHVEILSGLEQIVREETGRQGWALSEEKALELLRFDLGLNAQGLGEWLDQSST